MAGLVQNSGHNCIALEVLVTARGWAQRSDFIGAVQRKLDALPQRKHYYPGGCWLWGAGAGGSVW